MPGKILIKQLTQNKVGSILLAKEEKSNKGEVISVGPTLFLHKRRPMTPPVKEGDLVIFDPLNISQKVEINGEEYIQTTFQDILAIINE